MWVIILVFTARCPRGKPGKRGKQSREKSNVFCGHLGKPIGISLQIRGGRYPHCLLRFVSLSVGVRKTTSLCSQDEEATRPGHEQVLAFLSDHGLADFAAAIVQVSGLQSIEDFDHITPELTETIVEAACFSVRVSSLRGTVPVIPCIP